MTDAAAPDGTRFDNAGVKVPPPVVYATGFAAGVALGRTLSLPRFPRQPAVAAVCGAAGTALLASTVVLFRRAGTHLEPWEPTTTVVQGGPYRFTRNPIYLGFALVYTGAAAWWRVPGALLTLPGVVALIDRYVIRREERYLERQFGDEYLQYKSRVRRWL